MSSDGCPVMTRKASVPRLMKSVSQPPNSLQRAPVPDAEPVHRFYRSGGVAQASGRSPGDCFPKRSSVAIITSVTMTFSDCSASM